MKNLKYIFFITLVMFAIGSVHARDKGDLVLNIEPQYALFMFPSINVKMDLENLDLKNIDKPYTAESVNFTDDINTSGIGIGVKVVFNYYILDFLAVNLGIGFDSVSATFLGYSKVDGKNMYFNQDFSVAYYSIPIGVRGLFKSFVFGAGFTYNLPILPIDSRIQLSYDGKTEYLYGNLGYLPYFGLNFDIGYKTSGKKRAKNEFSVALRYSTSISRIIGYNDLEIKYDPFRFQGIYLVFQPGIYLNNFNNGD